MKKDAGTKKRNKHQSEFFICMAFLIIIVLSNVLYPDDFVVNASVPDTGSRQISDSWEEIIDAVNDGTYADKYHIGDTKELDLGADGIITMTLVAIDTDELSDNSGTASMTWIAADLLYTECIMEPYLEYGGWETTELRSYLRQDIFSLIPLPVRQNIKEVTKYSYNSETSTTTISPDTIWIPSEREIFGDLEHEGPQYSYYSNRNNRKKTFVNASVTSWWWLRSQFNDSAFYSVSEDGVHNASNKYIMGGIAIGFCF